MIRQRQHWILPCALGALFGLLAWSANLLAGAGRISALWLANGLLLGFLLADRSKRWRILLVAAGAANIAANLLIGDAVPQAIGLALCNSIEVAISYFALRRYINAPHELFTSRALVRFIQWAVLAAPAAGSALAAMLLVGVGFEDLAPSMQRRFVAHALGSAVLTPLVIAFLSTRDEAQPRARLAPAALAPYFILALSVGAIFLQTRFPFMFLLFAPFLWVVLKDGYFGAALSVAIIAVIAIGATVAEVGPLMLLPEGTAAARVLSVQLLLVTCVATSYPICALIARQRELLASIAAREQQLRVIADNSRDIIVHTDRRGLRTYVSPAIRSMLGYEPAEAVGIGGSGAIHTEDREMFEREEAALAAGAEGTVASYRVRHRNGNYVWVEVTAKTIRSADGAVTGWISTTRDVSERKRVEQMKESFVATVSHELRTPLTAITCAIGIAQSGRLGTVQPAIARLLEIAKSNGQRLSLLVNDILDVDKLASGRMEFDLQAGEVDTLLAKALATNESYAHRFKVRYELGSSCGARINVDAHRFQQVMSNLLSNAAKFSHEGGLVWVDAMREGEDCVIRVIDRGIGIPASFQSRMFERFAQADPSDGRSRAGTGLGMAIAKEIVLAMGGRISFESEEGVGTTFYVAFPAVAANVANAA